MATGPLQKFIGKISKSPQFKKAISEVQKVADDLKGKASNLNINVHLSPEAKKKIQEALKQYQTLAALVTETEKQMETEINKLVVNFRKKQTEVEKNLNSYKKKASDQKKKIEKLFTQKTSARTKAASTVKKATKKVSKKTTTKKATKKTTAKR